MEKRNIYKLDDLLIVISFLMLIPAAVLAWPWLITLGDAENFADFFLSAPGIIGYRFELVLFYLIGSAAAQFLGRLVRRKEKQSLKILDYMLYARDTSTDHIAQSLKLSESRVSSICSHLSTIADLNLHKEGNRVWIALPDLSSPPPSTSFSQPDLPRETVQPSDAGKTNPRDLKGLAQEMRQLMDNPNLSDEERKAQLKQSLQEHHPNLAWAIDKTNPGSSSAGGSSDKPKGKISPLLIVILIFTPLWPLGVFLVFKLIAQRKAEAAKKDQS